MQSSASYLKSFLEKGKIVVSDRYVNFEEKRKIFHSVLMQLHLEHPRLVEECTIEKTLKIDHKNLIIEITY
jgi:hypothetical protein